MERESNKNEDRQVRETGTKREETMPNSEKETRNVTEKTRKEHRNKKLKTVKIIAL